MVLLRNKIIPMWLNYLPSLIEILCRTHLYVGHAIERFHFMYYVLVTGGHVGRFCVWTESAIKQLDGLYGTWRKDSEIKKGYNLPIPKMTNTDLSRLLKSDEIQKVIRAPK